MFNRLLFLMFIGLGQTANGQGVDFNPGLFGCIMSGGDCLTATGHPFIDQFFSREGAPRHTQESFCYAWLKNWCDGPDGYNSAFQKCRDVKKQMYKHMKQKMGEWPSQQDFVNKYPPARWKPKSNEETYFDEIETREHFRDDSKALYFTCTPKQQYIWLKNKCENTQWFNRSPIVRQKDYSEDTWSRMRTTRC